MKSNVIKTLLSASLVPVLVFTSCENFLSGSLIKEDIEKQIAYAHASEVSIDISPEQNSMGTTIPSGSKIHKVSDDFTVSFKENTGYQFEKWVVKNYSTGELYTDVLDIEFPEKLETKVTVLKKADNIKLLPLVHERPAVENFSPSYSDDGVPRDCSISIAFTKNISAENDFSAIQITCNGDSISESFLEPVLNENILTIAADKTNLIKVDSGKTKTVTVKIPADFFYEENGSKVMFGTETKFTYRINSTTNDKTEITFSVATAAGTISPNGTVNYNLGDVINLKYEISDDYKFKGWSVLDGEGKEVSDSILSFKEAYSSSTTVTVKSKMQGVSIAPKSVLVPKLKVCTPEYLAAGVSYDKKVVLKFNKKLNASSVVLTSMENNVSGSISIVSVMNEDEHLEKYFTLDVTDNEISLIPDITIAQLVSQYSSVYDIKILLNANGKTILDNEGEPVAGNPSHTYRILNSYEDDPSKFYQIRAARAEAYLIDDTNIMKQGNFEQILKPDYLGKDAFFTDVYHMNSIYFDFDIYDEFGGLSKIKVTEKYLYKPNNNNEEGSDTTKETLVDFSSLKPVKSHYKKTFRYDFSSELIDGITEVTLTPVDVFGRSGNSVTYTVIRDTTSPSKTYTIWHTGPINSNVIPGITEISEYDDNYDYSQMKNRALSGKFIKISSEDDVWCNYNGADYKTPKENFILTASIRGTESGVVEKGTLAYSNNVFYFENLNYDEDFILTYTIDDGIGNVLTETSTITKKPVISYVETADEKYYIHFVDFGGDLYEVGIYWEELDSMGNIVATGAQMDQNAEKELPAGKKYNCYTFRHDEGGISSKYVIENGNVHDAAEKPEFNLTFEPVRERNSNKYILKVTIPQEKYTEYDSMILCYGSNEDKEDRPQVLTRTKFKSNTIEIPFNATGTEKEFMAKVTGIKNGNIYTSDVEYYSFSTDIKDDYSHPHILDSNTIDKAYSTLRISIDDYPYYSYSDTAKITMLWTTNVLNTNFIDDPEKDYGSTVEKRTFILPIEDKVGKFSTSHYIYFPLEDFSAYDSDSSVFAKIFLYDNNDNYLAQTITDKLRISYSKDEISLNDTNTVKIDTDMDIPWNYYLYYQYYDSATSSWQDINYEIIRSKGETKISDLERINLTSKTSGQFIKLWTGSEAGQTSSAPVYYLYDAKSKRTCDTKSYIYNKQLSIIHDKPVFVHTLYSTVDFGDDDKKWERYCASTHKINPKLIQPKVNGTNFSTYDIDLSSIPNDNSYYYTVIIHYADGTTEIIPSKLKAKK